MKLKDIIILLSSVIIFVISSYFFIQKEQTLPGQVRTEVIGVVDDIKNIAKRKLHGTIAWTDLSQKQEIFDRDRVFTDNESILKIKFNDATELELPPNSLMVLEKGKSNLELELKEGLMNLNFNENNKAVDIKLGEERMQIASTNAKVQVSVDNGDKSELGGLSGAGMTGNKKNNRKANVTVLDGQATVNYRGKELKIEEYEKVVLDEESNKIQKAEVILSLQTPFMDQKLFFKQNEPIGFSWRTKAQVQEFKIVVAKDPLVKDVVIEKESSTAEVNLIIPEMGEYYWKVMCLYQGVITSSPVYKFAVLDDIPPHLLYPEPRGIIFMGPMLGYKNVQLRWEPQEVEEYEVDFFFNVGGKSGSKMSRTKDPYLVIERLTEGDYQWRVRVVDERRPNSKWSEHRFFQVVPWEDYETPGRKKRSEPDFSKFSWP